MDYNKTIEELLKEYKTSEEGLSNEEVLEKRKEYGTNEITEKKKKSPIRRFLDQFNNVMIILLLIVGILSFIYSTLTGTDYADAIVILFSVIVNAIMGYFQEKKAENSLESLKNYVTSTVEVIRENQNIEIDSKNEINNSTIVSNEIKGTNNIENIENEINYEFNQSVESNAMNNVNNNVKSMNLNINEVSNGQKENTASAVSNNIASTNMNTGEVVGVQKESTASAVSSNMTSTNMNVGEVVGVQKENTASAVSSNIDSINKNNSEFIQPNSINDLF